MASVPPTPRPTEIDDDLQDIETQPLNGIKTPVSPASPYRRPLLLLLPLVIVSGILMVAVMAGYVDTSRKGAFHRFVFRQSADVSGTSHPDSSFYQRGKRFDVKVKRDRAVLLCMHDNVLALGVSLIRELRCLGNKELIQVYHCGPEELSYDAIELLFSIDNRLEIVDVCSDLASRQVISDKMADKFRNWWIKPLAVYHTDVRHVMLMDVDDIVIKNPAILRDLEEYHKTGTTFFYDRVHSHCNEFVNGDDEGSKYLPKLFSNFSYDRFNVTGGENPSVHVLESFAYTGKTCHEMDSSLVLVDKERAGQTVMDVMLWFITEERFRFRYSFGDKETFWLSFEMAHVPYSFSPWGVSVVSSSPNKDAEKHPDSLCGSILQYLPDSGPDAEMLYVNGKALLDPYPEGVDQITKMRSNNMFNTFPTLMTPRQERQELNKSSHPELFSECLIGLGGVPLPQEFAGHLLRRRLFYLGVTTGVLGALQHCETYEMRRLLDV
ncbi:hypothetical protein F441_18812 [Phytophthora nicotianae CJ01A1]|uniref:Uncharacterized protein n=1 Tax=Phytophthora nicotianae CJ01A1 TaxID=1317063 RepID=W2W1V9_PHYNI|nr:hypothetical protein F441_18812 [Phytophthora nicotianae CJ01A1]